MDPTNRVVDDAAFRQLIARARAMSPEEKVAAGPRLFERACRELKDQIRSYFPQATEEQLNGVMKDVMTFTRRLVDPVWAMEVKYGLPSPDTIVEESPKV